MVAEPAKVRVCQNCGAPHGFVGNAADDNGHVVVCAHCYHPVSTRALSEPKPLGKADSLPGSAPGELHPALTRAPIPTEVTTLATSTRRVERARRTLNVFALLGFVFAFVMPLLGLIFGIIGSVQIGDQPDRYHGQSLAVLGILISVLWPVALFLIFFASL